MVVRVFRRWGTRLRGQRRVVAARRWLRRWARPRRVAAVVLLGAAVAAAVVLGSVARMDALSGEYRYDTVEEVPARPVALVLGNKVHDDGTPAVVLARRLDTALRLYRAGKVRAVLVSGDSGDPAAYDEVGPMRRWLIARGVPSTKVVGDPAGFDSYDSCVRAVKVYGVSGAVVVTQGYHLSRAVALCRRVGMDAVGVSAGTRGVSSLDLRRRELREDLACVKAVADLALRPDPSRLGRRERGIDDALR